MVSHATYGTPPTPFITFPKMRKDTASSGKGVLVLILVVERRGMEGTDTNGHMRGKGYKKRKTMRLKEEGGSSVVLGEKLNDERPNVDGESMISAGTDVCIVDGTPPFTFSTKSVKFSRMGSAPNSSRNVSEDMDTCSCSTL